MPAANTTQASLFVADSEPVGERVPIEAVIITPELTRRRPHERDLASEHLAVTALMEEMASAAGKTCSDRILQRLADTTLALSHADSAGISVLEMDGTKEVFRWRAIAGQWAHLAGGTISRKHSACGLVVDTNKPVLMAQPHRHYGLAPGFAPVDEVLLIPFHFEDRPVGALWVIAQDAGRRRFDAEDLRLLTSLARYASIAYRLMLRQDRMSQLRLEAELADSRLLQAISAELITENDEKGFGERLLDAAVSIVGSDCASLQMFKEDAKGGHLELIAHRGFSQEAIDRWTQVDSTTLTTCGEVLRSGRRVIVEDVSQCTFMADSEDLAFFLRGGIQAVQSTPLLSRSGRLLGAFSTHWRRTHAPSARDLALLDLVARQAADLFERMIADERLRESDRRKEEFLATLAHELRNPLAPILNAVQCLNLAGPIAPEMSWVRDVIVRQTTHLSRLVDDLLDVSRINQDSLELKRAPIDLARVVHTAVETTQPFVTQRRQRLTVALPAERVTVNADPMRLAQVFANLLNNAAKFSSEGGRIDVFVEPQGEVVRVSVRDRGIGIEASDLPSVFDLFKRVHPTIATDHGGLGIGLTLVKRLVEMHGGTVTASSEGAGLGSEFAVQLPVVSSKTDVAVAEVASPSVRQARLRVLVVDDHEDGATSMCRLLRVLGYEARQASDGLAGFEAAEAFLPNAVLLDIGMPKLNGYDVARRLRAEPWGKTMLIVAVTGWGQESDKQRAKEAGFDHHLTKPVALTDLTRVLASVSAT